MKKSNAKIVRLKAFAWLRAARLQFFPMAWIAYSLGAVCAVEIQGVFFLRPYLAGYICIFLLELLTVLLNDYFDYDTDLLNQNASLYNGGSRVLVKRQLTFREVRIGVSAVLLMLVPSAWLLVQVSPNSGALTTYCILFLGLFLGAGYTVPPLQFSYRGYGEIVVAFTHSFYVIMAGFYFQIGRMNAPAPWLLSIPLFFAVTAAILLAALPDYRADKAVSKKTLAVLLGPRTASAMAIFCIAAAVVSAFMLVVFEMLNGPGAWLFFVCIPHALILSFAIARVYSFRRFAFRIDRVLQLALSFIVWFGLIPLAVLLWQKV